jgi:outer membrane protein assembly factor BamB
VAAIVEREDGSIDGLLVVDPELRLLDMAGAVRWTAKRSVGHHESASAITREKTVFIATFPEFSSGSDLSAYDVATGARVWKGVVERLSIGHSEYFNEVRLSIVDNRLVLRGDESAIVTTQVFDLANGNRQFASSHHR